MVMGDIIKKSLVAKQALGNFHQLKLVMPTVHLPATGLVKHHLTETAETAETAVQPRINTAGFAKPIYHSKGFCISIFANLSSSDSMLQCGFGTLDGFGPSMQEIPMINADL